VERKRILEKKNWFGLMLVTGTTPEKGGFAKKEDRKKRDAPPTQGTTRKRDAEGEKSDNHLMFGGKQHEKEKHLGRGTEKKRFKKRADRLKGRRNPLNIDTAGGSRS